LTDLGLRYNIRDNMELKLRKIGNSYGVILPAEVLAALQVREGGTLTLIPDQKGQGYQLRSSNPDFERKLAVLKDTVEKYKNALRELAK
jgi:putative addiction module antidote